EVVAVAGRVVVAGLPAHLAAQHTVLGSVDGEIAGPAAHPHPGGDAARSVDGDVAGTPRDVYPHRPRGPGQGGLRLVGSAAHAQRHEMESGQVYGLVGSAPADVLLPGDGLGDGDAGPVC